MHFFQEKGFLRDLVHILENARHFEKFVRVFWERNTPRPAPILFDTANASLIADSIVRRDKFLCDCHGYLVVMELRLHDASDASNQKKAGLTGNLVPKYN